MMWIRGIWLAVGLLVGLLVPGSPTAEAAEQTRKGFFGRGIDIARVDGESEHEDENQELESPNPTIRVAAEMACRSIVVG